MFDEIIKNIKSGTPGQRKLAIESLTDIKNKYMLIKITPSQEKDIRECALMTENGKDKDCEGCSCKVCMLHNA